MVDQSNPYLQSFVAKQIGPERYKQMLVAQQQEALGNALLQEGTTPINTNNRMMGNIAYKISPWEGIAKIGQALTGGYEQAKGNEALANALLGNQSSNQDQNAQSISGNAIPNISGQYPPQIEQQGQSNTVIDKLPSDIQAQYAQWSMPESMGGNPRAAAELIKDFSPGVLTNEQRNLGGPNSPAMQNYIQNASNPVMSTQIGGAPVTLPTDIVRNMGNQQYGAQNAPVPILQQLGIDPMSGTKIASQPMPSSGGIPFPPQVTAFSNPQVPAGTSPEVTNAALSTAAHAMPRLGGLTPQEQAAIEAQKEVAIAAGKAPIAAQQTGAEQNAKDLAEAQKASLAFQSQLPGIKDTIQHLIEIAPNVSYAPGSSMVHHFLNDQQSATNADFHQGLNALKTFGTQFAATPGMGRMDLPIIQAAQGATSPEAGGNPMENKAYLERILHQMNLRDQALHGQANALQNPSASMANNQQVSIAPNIVHWVMKDGKLVKQ